MTHLMEEAEIASGEIPIAEARRIVRDLLETFDREKAERIYVALRAWTWKSLNAKRRDPELREWYDLFKRVVAFLKTDHPDLALKLTAYHELIYETVMVSEVLTVEEVVRRRHVRETLSLLAGRENGGAMRTELLEALGLGQPNLTRVVNLMLSSGLLERESFGRTVEFRLSSDGWTAARKLMPEVSRPSVPDAIPDAYHAGA